MGGGGRRRLEASKAVATLETLARWQQAASELHVADALLDYVQALLAESRALPDHPGLSPRAGLALLAAARAWAWLAGRAQVLPEDVQAVWVPVAGHRLGPEGDRRAAAMLREVAVP
jgi:MoxR-like ATPase